MQYRNAKSLGDGRYDCEINHPIYGWIPFTADRNDTGALFDVTELVDAIQSNPLTAPYTPPTEEEQAALKAQVRQAMSMTFAQLLIGLVKEGWITEAEGDAWADGNLPTIVTVLISTLPAASRFAARVRAKRPSVVLRTDPLVTALAQVQGKTDEQLDAFFITYGAV